MRSLLITLHKYAGLVLGLLLSVTGITGSVLVFDHALDEALSPETVSFRLPDSSGAGNPAPLQAVLDAAQAAVEGNPPPTRIELARKPGSPHIVRFPAPEGATGPIEVSVAPADAEALAVRTWGSYPTTWLYRLHYKLLAGETGEVVVGVVGLVLLFFCISGVIIWWPRPGQWRRALTIKGNGGSFRFNYDLHKTAGVYFLPVLIVVAFSGVSLVFHTPMEKLVGSILPVEHEPAPRSTGRGPTIDADRALAAGQRAMPEANLRRLFTPRDAEGSYQLVFNQPGEPWSTHGASAVWVDQYSAEVLALWDVTNVAAGSKFLEWQFPLHNGDALGLVGRWVVFVSGLLPALLFGTGVYMWWRKWRRGNATLRGKTSALEAS